MLDLLAAISSVDPPALLAWLVLAFAAGMYPVGIMLGSSCSPCCGCNGGPGTCETTSNCAGGCVCVDGQCVANPCSQCTEGELPDTVTVTFSGLQDRTPGPDLCLLTFSAPYGSGAAGKVTAPGGDPDADKGPLTAVSLTNGGSGYAKLGRVAPTITASGGSGTGATFSVSTTSANDANGIPSWSVSGVTMTGTPTGYVDGDQITFEVAEGDTVEQGAAATIQTTRTAPTLTASASGGSGAAFSVTTAANGTTPQTWSVTGVTVTNGGTGYPATGSVTFNKASGDTEAEPASATFYSGRVAPTVTVAVGGSGSGAVLSGTLSSGTDYYGRAYWYISSISVTNGGSGYSEYDLVSATVTDGTYGFYSNFYAFVSVDEDGAVTGVTLYDGGEFFKSNGTIASVEIDYYYGGGSYYRDDGVITGVTVDAGGKYYREDASASPYVATVTVGVTQTPPSAGTGATLTATVESSTSSANFGKITGVTITSGGTNYLAWEWKNTLCCGWYWNGKPVVLKRNLFGSSPCTYTHPMCGGWNISGAKGRVGLTYNGPSTPPALGIITEWLPSEGLQFSSRVCDTSFTASSNVTNCSEWSGVSFSSSGGATATVSAGGDYDAEYKAGWCHPCCQGEEPVDAEITVSLTSAENGYHDVYAPSGDYVLTRSQYGWFWSGGTPELSFNISLSIGLCADHCDECIKKCTTAASVGLQSHPSVWFNPAEYDMRSCFQWDLEYGSDEYNATECANFCTLSNPTCKPSGTFNFYKANWSENFSASGCPGCCDENTEPTYNPETEEFDGPPLEHRNVFVLEVIG